MWVTGYNWVASSDLGPEDVGLVTCRITVCSGDAAKILELISFINTGRPIPSREPGGHYESLGQQLATETVAARPPANTAPLAAPKSPPANHAQDASPSDSLDSPTRFSFLEID